MYTLLLAIIYLAFICLGLPDSLLGTAWPVVHAELAVPLSYAGIVSIIIHIGTVISSLLSERLTVKFGTRGVTVFSVFLTAVALFGFSRSDAMWMLCLWAVPYGLGAGAIDSALNNYVALHYTARHMSWLHCFWGVGALISPYIMSLSLTHANWQTGYLAVSLLLFVCALLFLFTLKVWNINKKKVEDRGAKEVLGLRNAIAVPGVKPWLVGFFGTLTIESCMILWTSSYLVQVRNFSEEAGAALASLFYIGMTAGRFVSGFVADKKGDRTMIRGGCLIAVCGMALMLVPLKSVTVLGVLCVGLGMAPCYPSVIHHTPILFGERNSQAIIGIQMASAYTGSTLMPPLFGLISGFTGMWVMPFFMAAAMVLMRIMQRVALKTVDARKAAQSEETV